MARNHKQIKPTNMTQTQTEMTKQQIIDNIRVVNVSQNSWQDEDLLLLTTLTDEQIETTLKPLIEEERQDESGEVIYSNEDMANILSEKYPDDIVVLYAEPDYLTI
jgi:hypothetical protein